MKTLHFSTKINAPKEKVWQTLWQDETYRQWTGAFSEGSYAVSDWEEGDKILFLSPAGEGMFSVIEKNVPNEFMSFKHLGAVKGGEEQPADEESKKWSGATENYTLRQNNDMTELEVTINVTEDFEQYLKDTFPRALDNVKTISEK